MFAFFTPRCWGRHHLLRRGGGTGGIAQLDGSLEQRDARHVVTGRFGHIYTVRGLVTRYPKANSGVHGAVAVDAQCGAQAAQASAKSVGPVDQVAQVQSASCVAAVELNAAMAVGIVEHQVVISAATDFLTVDAPPRGAAAATGYGRCRASESGLVVPAKLPCEPAAHAM